MPRQKPGALQIFQERRADLIGYAASITGDRSAAEDLVQEAWLLFADATATRHLAEPASYLFRIVRNLALDRSRRRGFEQKHFVEDTGAHGQVPSNVPDPEALAIARNELQIVQDAIARMPERMRIALEMHRLEGAKLKDIATHLGISITIAHELVAEGVKRCRRCPSSRHLAQIGAWISGERASSGG